MIGPYIHLKSMRKIAIAIVFWFTGQVLTAQQNIILIIADDMGADYCGFYENAVDTANMPNIRGLLARGVRFQNAWASPICSPTRAGILTGRYSFRTGVGTAISGPEYGQIDTAEMTIPKLLKYYSPSTYATANIGKWHLNQQTPQSLLNPNRMGYDRYSGNFLGELTSYYDWKKTTDGVASTITNYATTETVNDAIDWLDGLGTEQPFFLWLAFNAPHSPYHKPPDALHTVPGLTGTQQHINQNPKLYFRAAIEAMDTELGRLFTWLQQNGEWENTNIVFIGDNGNPKRVSQIADTTQGKGTLYEYGVRVPFIFSGPAVVQPGRVTNALASTPDLFATSLEVAGFSNWEDFIPAGKPVDSQSLLPILKNETTTVRNWIFSEQFSPTSIPVDGKAIRNPTYKLIDFDDGRQEFYHLDNDPTEQLDLLLAPTLSPEELTNYNYLCTELGNLIGTNSCNTSVSNLEPGPEIFSVQPNPASEGGCLQLRSTASGTCTFRLYNAIGGQVQVVKFEGSVTLPLAGLPAGTYAYRIENESTMRLGQIVVH